MGSKFSYSSLQLKMDKIVGTDRLADINEALWAESVEAWLGNYGTLKLKET